MGYLFHGLLANLLIGEVLSEFCEVLYNFLCEL